MFKKILLLTSFVFLGSASVEMGEVNHEKTSRLMGLLDRDFGSVQTPDYFYKERKSFIINQIKEFLDSDCDIYEEYDKDSWQKSPSKNGIDNVVRIDANSFKEIQSSYPVEMFKTHRVFFGKIALQNPLKATRAELQDFLEHEADTLPLDDPRWEEFMDGIGIIALP